MKLYEVQSGEINGCFRAVGPQEAFLKAIRRVQKIRDRKVPMPGLVARAREVEEDFKPISDWTYFNPLDIIKRL